MPNHDSIVALGEDLRERSYAIVDELLPWDLLHALAADCAAAESEGRVRRAGTGRVAQLDLESGLRADSILWLERGDPASPQSAFFDRMDSLRVGLNRELMLGLYELEAHYAIYPPGGGYARHRDRFRDSDARVLSMVVYLNADWREEDGGQLRLHLPEGARDVAPRMGTSVWFLSAEIEHEVLAAARTRRSIAGWFRQRSVS